MLFLGDDISYASERYMTPPSSTVATGPRVLALFSGCWGGDIDLQSGVTPLHRAAEVNSCQVAQVLINAGASVNARAAWGWYAPLHLALLK